MNSQTSANHVTKHFLSFGTEGVASTADCAKCVPIPVIHVKQDDPQSWVAENL